MKSLYETYDQTIASLQYDIQHKEMMTLDKIRNNIDFILNLFKELQKEFSKRMNINLSIDGMVISGSFPFNKKMCYNQFYSSDMVANTIFEYNHIYNELQDLCWKFMELEQRISLNTKNK